MNTSTHLAFDLGLAHTGIAISYEGQLAEGLTTIHTGDPDRLLQNILELTKEHSPQDLVIGYPLVGPINQLALTVKAKLEGHIDIPIHLVNEDHTTLLAQKALIDSNIGPKRRQQRTHQASAAAILQSYLDNLIK